MTRARAHAALAALATLVACVACSRSPRAAVRVVFDVDARGDDSAERTAAVMRARLRDVAGASVTVRGAQVVVELPGDRSSDAFAELVERLARVAKLELAIVDDGAQHDGSPYMRRLFAQVRDGDPEAKRLAIRAEVEQWTTEQSPARHTDYYLEAKDRDEDVPAAWAKKHGCIVRDARPNQEVHCWISGRAAIERYLYGDHDLGVTGLVDRDPTFRAPADRALAFADVTPADGKDRRGRWRTYWIERPAALDNAAIEHATAADDPVTNRRVVWLDFTAAGARAFGELTARMDGRKLATTVDGIVRAAPIVTGAIRGGRAQVQLGARDPAAQAREADVLASLLGTGALPAPVRLATIDRIGDP